MSYTTLFDKGYINHFLKRVHEINQSKILMDKDSLRVSFDVVSMFPSISNVVGLEQCEMHIMNNRCEPLFSTNCILDAISITLSNNLTIFEGRYVGEKYLSTLCPNELNPSLKPEMTR